MTTNNNTQCCTQKHNVQSVVQAGTPQLSAVQRIILLCVAVCFLLGAVPLSVRSQARKSEVPPSLLAGANRRGGDNRGRNITPFGQLKKEFNKGFDLDSLRRFKQYLREREKEENTRRAHDKQPPVFSGLDMEFGVPMPLKGNDKLDMKKHGEWETLANGDRVWRLVVSAPNAVNMSFVFEEFDLPVGSKLYVYSTENAERRDPAQYYTSEHCDIRKGKTKQFAIAPLSGSTIIFEYYEPASLVQNKNKSVATIVFETITFGYERIGTFNEVPQSTTAKGKTTANWNGNYSGNCGPVPCGPGATDGLPCMAGADPSSGLYPMMQLLQKSAVQIINPATGSAFSATLLNSGSAHVWDRGRYRPENIVIAHSHANAMSAIETSIFRYNYEKNSGVWGNSSIEDYYGSTLLALGNPGAGYDFGVVKAHGAPLDAWYAGWTTAFYIGQSVTGLSFPWNDRMKVRHGSILGLTPSTVYNFLGNNVVYASAQPYILLQTTLGATMNYSSGGGNYDDVGNFVGINHGNEYDYSHACPQAQPSVQNNYDFIVPFSLVWNHPSGAVRQILSPGSISSFGTLSGGQYLPCAWPMNCFGKIDDTEKGKQKKLLTSDTDSTQLNPNLQIHIYPNPVADNLHAYIQSMGMKRCAIQILNSVQNIVKDVYEGNVSATFDFNVNIQDLPNGSYFLAVTGMSVNNKTLTAVKQFIIVK